MLRALSIRDFVVVDALDVEFDDGFSVLTGETGAGKSILVDALALLVGARFELRELRAGAARAEISAVFDTAGLPLVEAWLEGEGLAGDEHAALLRRTLDAQGRSRAWINGRPATLAQLAELGEMLVDLSGQNSHQALGRAPAQRALVDAYGGFSALTRETGDAFRAWRAAVAARDQARVGADALARERDELAARRDELAKLAPREREWEELGAAQSRLAHAAALIETAAAADAALDGDGAMLANLHALIQRVAHAARIDPALGGAVKTLESAATELSDTAHTLRDYLRKLDVDPQELARVEARLGALHDAARKHRVRAEELPGLVTATAARLADLAQSADLAALDARVAAGERTWRELADTLTKKRRLAASELADRATATMQDLAMRGGHLAVRLVPGEPAAHGAESVELDVAAHAAQPPGPLAKVASGGELARIALAIEVAASEVGNVPTLVFDEVDSGIGGAVAATVGKLLQTLGATRQVLCVTHLAQVAAHADHHFLVKKRSLRGAVASELVALDDDARTHELARMASGAAITDTTRAHARELREQHRRRKAPVRKKRA
jgi:DNA repair protein RecN (Recombination protein N)